MIQVLLQMLTISASVFAHFELMSHLQDFAVLMLQASLGLQIAYIYRIVFYHSSKIESRIRDGKYPGKHQDGAMVIIGNSAIIDCF